MPEFGLPASSYVDRIAFRWRVLKVRPQGQSGCPALRGQRAASSRRLCLPCGRASPRACVRVRAKSIELGQFCRSVCQIWPKSGRHRELLAESDPNLADVGPGSAEFAQIWPNLATLAQKRGLKPREVA